MKKEYEGKRQVEFSRKDSADEKGDERRLEDISQGNQVTAEQEAPLTRLNQCGPQRAFPDLRIFWPLLRKIEDLPRIQIPHEHLQDFGSL